MPSEISKDLIRLDNNATLLTLLLTRLKVAKVGSKVLGGEGGVNISYDFFARTLALLHDNLDNFGLLKPHYLIRLYGVGPREASLEGILVFFEGPFELINN